MRNVMTEYTVEISRRIKVTVKGRDTEENCEEALTEAVSLLRKQIDEDDLEVIEVEEYEGDAA